LVDTRSFTAAFKGPNIAIDASAQTSIRRIKSPHQQTPKLRMIADHHATRWRWQPLLGQDIHDKCNDARRDLPTELGLCGPSGTKPCHVRNA
jgi:hypothetical protein